MLYALTRFVCLTLFRVVWRGKVIGREHIPATGPLILASNHLSFIDSIVIPLAVSGRRVVFLAKAEYWEGKSLASLPRRLFFRTFDAVPVQREQSDAQASLQLALEVLGRGDAFGIYPEGTRSRDGLLYRGRTGVGWLALTTGAPVVPVGLIGTENLQPADSKSVKPQHFTMKVGEPLYFDKTGPDHSLPARRQVTDRIMDAIADLSGQERATGYNQSKVIE